MWISKKDGGTLELKSINILVLAFGPFIFLTGLLMSIRTIETKESQSLAVFLLDLFLLSVGIWLLKMPYEITAQFDKAQGVLLHRQKSLIFPKSESLKFSDMGAVQAVHVRRPKQSYFELRISLKNGGVRWLLGCALRREAMDAAHAIGAFLQLPVQESDEPATVRS